ncbi:MAG TPA: DUF1501 domain-containing protein [Kofleriaceae bacterium]|nr:DUF1501 domain-containing protein [Kofleriaceae bacterium]
MGLASLGAIARPRIGRTSTGGPNQRPRYFLVVYLGGGIDQILTTDPKKRSEIAPTTNRPYEDRDIIHEGGLRLGPFMAPMKRHAKRLTIINGIVTATVSHQTGALQHSRMKVGAEFEMPAIADLIGLYRDTQVLPSVNLGDADEYTHTSTWFGSPTSPADKIGLLDELGALSNDELLMLAEEVETGRAVFSTYPGARAHVAVDNLNATAKLLRRLSEVPRFAEEKWSDDPMAQWYAKNFQQSLWLFQHDLCRTVYMRTARIIFDTHFNNTQLQQIYCNQYFEMFARFLDVVETMSLAGAPAREQLLLVASSEVGRHPRLNTNAGKDHFPEAPAILYGAGLRPGQFVDTGRETEAFPVDLATGRKQRGGHVITLDDIGATMLELAGVDYQRYGHRGRPLQFALAK